jgi:hypothetical protein
MMPPAPAALLSPRRIFRIFFDTRPFSLITPAVDYFHCLLFSAMPLCRQLTPVAAISPAEAASCAERLRCFRLRWLMNIFMN